MLSKDIFSHFTAGHQLPRMPWIGHHWTWPTHHRFVQTVTARHCGSQLQTLNDEPDSWLQYLFYS